MTTRAARILVLVYAAWWLGVFMPGHLRGQVKVVGENEPTACHACPMSSGPDTSKTSDEPGESSAHCAVCVILARMNPPAAVEMDVPDLGELDELVPLAVIAQLHVSPRLAVLHGRAPPRLRALVI
jgi:hypothetical protein